jgi:23S rRNA (cytosine1962-C5)-methyltransferase
VKRGHPWVYAEGIRRLRHDGQPGDLAVMFDRRDRFLAIGLYDPASPIRIRVLQRGAPQKIDAEWLLGRLRGALDRRQGLGNADTTGFRVVHGENDGLPGLVLDRYDSSLVVKLYTPAWLPHLPSVVACMMELMGPERVVLRLSRAVQALGEGDALEDGQTLRGKEPSGPVLFRENGLRFEADLARGQKTGFFLDQRDNRALVERDSAGRSVLNVFSYTGGFSVYAARGGARSVTSLDASRPALAAAERNFGHNRDHDNVASANHRVLAGDAFEFLPRLRDEGARFDMVILDPPAFAKAAREVPRALRSYRTILRGGLDVLRPGGMLVAASCSSRVSAAEFLDLVQESAIGAGRTLRVRQMTGHPEDHPIGFPEGAYLKCVFAGVEG